MAWTIRGIDPSVKAAAEQAAASEGVPLRQWLEQAIMDTPGDGTLTRGMIAATGSGQPQAPGSPQASAQPSGSRPDEGPGGEAGAYARPPGGAPAGGSGPGSDASRDLVPSGPRIDHDEEDVPFLPDDEEAAIRDALAALEDRVDKSAARLSNLIEPLEEGSGGAKESSHEADRSGPGNGREDDENTEPGGLSAQRDPYGPPEGTWRPRRQNRRGSPLFLIVGFAVTSVALLGVAGWVWFSANQGRLPEWASGLPGGLGSSHGDSLPSSATMGQVPPSGAGAQQPSPAQFAAAQQGNAAAQYLIGMAHFEGRIVNADPKEAVRWLELAAAQGHAQAQLQLGTIYEGGIGVPVTPEQAFFWYQSAAEQGLAPAQYSLGLLYGEGRGTEKSPVHAREWFARAGEQDHAGALFQLGQMYDMGEGVARNAEEARGYYRRAADAGSDAAEVKMRDLEAQLGTGLRGIKTAPSPAPAGPAPGNGQAATPPVGPSTAPAAPSATGGTPTRLVPEGLDEAGIREVQRLLASLNFNPGPVTGRINALTQEAVRQYQEFAGLNVNGRLTPDLLAHIRDVAGAAGTAR